MRKHILPIAALALVAAGCHTDMWVQPKVDPQRNSDFFADGMASRKPVANTVARGQARTDDAFFKGRENGQFITEIPADKAMEILKLKTYRDFLLRGQDRYNIFCTPCHGQVGDGKGMIAARGLELKRPPGNYHTQRLRDMPNGHFFDVITNGYGVMFPYAQRVEPADRWAIVAYIRTLQKSQNTPISQVPAGEQQNLQSQPAPEGGTP